MLERLYGWMGKKVYSKHATLLLGVLFYLEAIFFLPTDPMLVFYCIERRKRSFWYATIATISSVLGGITGYFIGYFLWQTVGPKIIHSFYVRYIVSPDTFLYLCAQYKKYEHIAILIAGFTPVPYKAATLTAGFCQLSFIPFVIFSLIARGARMFLLAAIIYKWGVHMKKYIDRYLTLMVLLTVVIVGFVIWWLY